VLTEGEDVPVGVVVFRLCGTGSEAAVPGRPHVRMDEPDLVNARLLTALATCGEGCREVVLELGGPVAMDEIEEQRAAITVLDAICGAFD